MDRRQFTKKMLTTSALVTATPGLALSGLSSQHRIGVLPESDELPAFRSLFNGRDLSGFIDVNTSQDTWRVEEGLLICTGHPTGVMRTEKQYENFILDIEWRFLDAGGNSGVFIWADGEPFEDNPFPTGVEVQMLDPEWASIHERSIEYVHGQLFPVMGLQGTIPDHPSEVTPGRSSALEKRVRGTGEWNRYIVICVEGTIKLAVNGKIVNGMYSPKRKKGYICPEAEGAEIHFRKMNILELPSGVISPEQTAPLAENRDSMRFK